MINGNMLRDMYISGANNIQKNRVSVDELNIFPVPDGDTGTNMSMTMSAALKALSVMKDESVETISQTGANALLRGARGNSGVILSLLFRGFAKGFVGKELADGTDIANALSLGVEAAYKAVMKPTEGTILTVARLASEKAKEVAEENTDELVVFEAALEAAIEALSQTPELLPVLKKAGVVDAGGKGFVVIMEGMLSVLKDNVIIGNDAQADQSESTNVFNNMNVEDITFNYCTEFIIDKAKKLDKEPSVLRAYLESIGDSVVVVDDDQIIKVHVHTDNPGNALQKGLEYGMLVNIKIENMREQLEHNQEKSEPETKDGFDYKEPVNDYGFVAVCAGSGLHDLFAELGVDSIVSGGQTMNPSTDDILKAIKATPAKCVFVLPNNKNIIMAAEQAIPLADRKVIVLPTKTIPQGMSAMIAFDPDLDVENNTKAMTAAAENVSTGQITFAARDSDYDGHKIKEGEILALANGKLSFVDKDINKATVKLVKNLAKKDTSFITIIYGEGVTEEEAQSVEDAVSSKVGNDVEVVTICGNQPVYYYIISVE